MPNNTYNNVQCEGNLGRDPDVKYFESGSMVVKASIAVYCGKDKATGESRSAWVQVEAWGDAGSVLAELRKGDRLRVIRGSFDQQNWTDRETGQQRSKLLVKVWECEKIERQPKGAQQQAQPASTQPASQTTATQPQPASTSPAPDYDDIPF